MADLLFIAGFLATFTGYFVHTALHYSAHRKQTERLSRWADVLATGIIFVGYAGFGLMLATDPVTLGVSGPIALFGGLVGFAGVALFIAAVRSIHGFEETDELVTTGVYARVRHPMYLGILLLHLGFPILFNSALTLLSAAIWAPQILLWKRWEDEDLEKRFGEAYREYKRRTFF
jgi:protein-S-isoprenylcysteine O-methyltransferase Ste14